MNCRIAHDFLQQSLDGTPIESPEWLAHLQQCAECRALASAGRRLQNGLRLLTAPLPPPDLAERIVERVMLDRRRVRRRLRRRWAIGVALAASLLLALFAVTWQPKLPVRTTALVNRQRQLPGDSPVQKEKTTPTLRESAAELGEFFTQLSDETVGQTRRWVVKVPNPLQDGTESQPPLEPPTSPLREARESLSEGLEPVTTSARRAVDLFLRELPMETKTN